MTPETWNEARRSAARLGAVEAVSWRRTAAAAAASRATLRLVAAMTAAAYEQRAATGRAALVPPGTVVDDAAWLTDEATWQAQQQECAVSHAARCFENLVSVAWFAGVSDAVTFPSPPTREENPCDAIEEKTMTLERREPDCGTEVEDVV